MRQYTLANVVAGKYLIFNEEKLLVGTISRRKSEKVRFVYLGKPVYDDEWLLVWKDVYDKTLYGMEPRAPEKFRRLGDIAEKYRFENFPGFGGVLNVHNRRKG